MKDWFIYNAGNLIVSAVLFALAAAVIIKLLRQRRSPGHCGCESACSCCSLCGSCRADKE